MILHPPAPDLPNAWAGLSFAQLIKDVDDRLQAVGIEEAELDSRQLLSAVFGDDVWQKIAEPKAHPAPGQLPKLAVLVQRRLGREPLSHILGSKGFWSLDLEVSADVLTPRADTEALIESALHLTHDQQTGTVLDLGTGSGAVLLAFLSERPGWTGTGIDISNHALAMATRNAAASDLENRTKFSSSDWADLPDANYDLILSNPPYIAQNELTELEPEVRLFEPTIALNGGPDGLDAYRFLSKNVSRWLRQDGHFAFEIGHRQASAVTHLLAAQGQFTKLTGSKDLAGRDRVVCGQMATKTQGKGKH